MSRRKQGLENETNRMGNLTDDDRVQHVSFAARSIRLRGAKDYTPANANAARFDAWSSASRR